MRKLVIVGLLLIVIITMSACLGPPSVGPEESTEKYGWTWSLVESPITGKCYEVITRRSGYNGYAGMAEVPCSDLNKDD